MAQLIEAAAWTKYNANSRGNDVGDCVCRSISLAFDIPYATASKQLNARMKQLHLNQWNISPVYEHVILQNGGSMCTAVEERPYPTVDEFADAHQKYCYLVLCGKSPSDWKSSHLVCIIEGKVYDSWDSRSYYAKKYYTCSYDRHINESDIADHIDELTEYADDIVYHEIDKYARKWLSDTLLIDYKLDYESMNDSLLIKQAWWVEYTITTDYGGEPENHMARFSVAIPLKPGMSVEDAKATILKVGKQRAYDRMYAVRESAKKNKEAYQSAREKVDGDGAEVADQRWLFLTPADQRFVRQLPGKVRPYISYLHIYDPGQHSNSYEIHIKRMPRDPNPKKEIRIEAWDANAAKDMVKRYAEKFERPYDDYDPYEDY